MKLLINQNTGVTEQVTSDVIDKLYNMAINNQLDANSDVKGRITATAAYEDAVRYLAGIENGDPKRFPDLFINIPNSNYYIRFEDPGVAFTCKNEWGDGVGTTMQHVQVVTNIGTKFKGASIRKFNELKFFGITYLSDSAFEDCTSLSRITLPANVTTLGRKCFFKDILLSKINVENLISIGSFCFSVDSSTQMLFANGDVLNFKSLTSAGTCLFGGCNLAQLYMPKLTASSPNCEYRNYYTRVPMFASEHGYNFSSNLLYLRDIQKIYTGTFAGITCSALVINNATPPEWANTHDKTDTEAEGTDSDKNRMFRDCNIGGQGMKIIYVPDAAITDYQNHALWGANCTFKGISELNNNVKYATYEDWLEAGKPVALIEEYM